MALTWTEKQTMIGARETHGAAWVGGFLYVWSGSVSGSLRTTVERYDPGADSWASRTAIPTGVQFAYGGAVSGVIYTIAGSTHQAYDTVANTWTSKAAPPQSRAQGTVRALGGKVYVGGAFTGGSYTNSGRLHEYDPGGNTWAQKAAMPLDRARTCGDVHGGLLYIGLGANGATLAKNLYAWDPDMDTWTEKAASPTLEGDAREILGAFIGDLMYVIKGTTPETWTYDAPNNVWASEVGSYRDTPAANRPLAVLTTDGALLWATGGDDDSNVTTNLHTQATGAPVPPTEPEPTALEADPASQSKPKGATAEVTLTIKDQFDVVMAGERIRWAVTGVSSAQGQGLSDSLGRVVASWIVAGAGTDTLHAWADANDDGIEDVGEPTAEATVTGAVFGSLALEGFRPATPAHVIEGPHGGFAVIQVGGWQALEEAALGQIGATGRIRRADLLAHPDVLVEGARWWTFARETGETLFWAEIKQPADNGGVVDLSGSGAAALAEGEAGRILYQSASYTDWVEADSDPHEYALHKRVEVDVKGGRIVFRPERDHAFAGGEQGGAVFWAFAQHLRRITFKIRKSDDDANWELVLAGANTEDNGIGSALTQIQTWGLGAGNPDGTVVDLDGFGGEYDLLRLGLRAVAANTPGRLRFWVTELRVNTSRAPDDEFSASDVVRDILGELGIADRAVRESGAEAMPADFRSATYADPLQQMAFLSGRRMLLYPEGLQIVGDFAAARRRTWRLVDPESPRDLLPLPIYNHVVVTIREADGSVIDDVEAHADPDPIPEGRRTLSVALENPGTRVLAGNFAEALVDLASRPRYQGTITCHRVADADGLLHSSQYVHAGDLLYVPTLGWSGMVFRHERSDGPSVFGFEDPIPALIERYNARQRRRLALRGRA